MLPRFLFKLGFLAFILLSALAQANNQLIIKDDSPDNILLQDYLYKWTGEKQTIDKLKDSIYFFSYWQPAAKNNNINLPSDQPAFFMLSLKNISNSNQELVLMHPKTSLSVLKILYLHEDSSITKYQSGNHFPFTDRPILHRQFIFPLTLKKGESLTVLMEAKGRMDGFANDILVTKRQPFFEKTDSELIILSVYFSILLLLAIFNGILYLTVREISYAWFTLSICVVLVRAVTANNMFFEFLWPNIPALQESVLVLSMMASSTLTTLFTLAFLGIDKKHSTIAKIYSFYLVLHIPTIILQALCNWSILSITVWLLCIALPFSLFCWGSSLWLYKQGNKNAGIFLIGYSTLLFSGFFAAGNEFFNFNIPLFRFIEDIGQLLQILIFTVAISISIGSTREKTYLTNAKNKAKNDFLAKMSHEIRTPINGVLGMAQLLSETPLSRKQQHYADVINHCSKTLLNVINDILEYSKIEAGKLEFEHTPFNLDELLLNNNSLFWPQIHNKQIIFKYWIDPKIPLNLIGDPSRLQQIFNNLFSNAIKFTDIGHIKLSVSLLKFDLDIATIQFCVSDTGIGMSAEEMERIFAPFSQASSSTNRFYGGSGLGLNITQQLVKLMDGEISVKSEVKNGTKFCLTIPFKIEAQAEYKRHKELKLFYKKRALVISNNANNQDLLVAHLRHWNIETVCFSEFNDALPSIALQDEHNFDIFCVDAQLLRQLHHSKKSHLQNFAQKLLVFDCSFNEFTDQIFEFDNTRFLLAPFSILQVKELIESILGLNIPKKVKEDISENKTFKPRNSLRILVAEDDATNRLVIRAILKKLHIEHDIVTNGLLAKERYQEAPSNYDIILMDCEMPEMNGYQATVAIREFENSNNIKAIPIIALTAHVLPEYEQRCYESGMNLVLAKPININDLSLAFDKYSEVMP